MLRSFYEFEKTTKNRIYDNIREYCKAEQVNEEHFRACLRRKGKMGSMKKAVIILAAVVGLFVFTFLSMDNKIGSELESLEYYDVNLNEIENGIYQGKAETTFVKAEVEVEVNDHEIIRINLLKHDNGLGKEAERITEDMIRLNTYEVDAVSGATSSSQVIKSAVSAALANKKK